MNENVTYNNIKILPKGQITLPKDYREALNFNDGDQITAVLGPKSITLMKTSEFALQMIQDMLAGEMDNLGLKNDDDIAKLFKKFRDSGDNVCE